MRAEVRGEYVERTRINPYREWYGNSFVIGCLVYWYDSRSGCERSQLQFPDQPSYAGQQPIAHMLLTYVRCWSWKQIRNMIPIVGLDGIMRMEAGIGIRLYSSVGRACSS